MATHVPPPPPPPSYFMPPMPIRNAHNSQQIIRRNIQSGISFVVHALPPKDILLYQAHISQKLQVNYLEELVIVPQLFVEPSINMVLALINEDDMETRHQVGEIHSRDVGVVNNHLIL